MTEPEIVITHEESDVAGAFHLGEVGRMTYRRDGENRMIVNHTFVNPSQRGKGLARALYHEMIAFARANGRRIVPECSFVAKMLRENPADQDLQV